MRAYVLTTGIVFGLLALAHVWRFIEEGPALARNPFFIVITVAAAALSFWGLRLFRQLSRS